MRRRDLILAVALVLVPGMVSGQPRGRGHDIGRVIADCEQRTNEFRRSFRYASERGYRDHMRLEDLNRHADRLERVMNVVRDSWAQHRDPQRTRRFVSDALATGQEINRSMARGRLHPQIQRQWSAIRSELNRMAEAFELPRIRW